MIDIIRDDDDEEENQEFLSQTSALESMMIQAIINETTSIVRKQNRNKKPTQEESLKSAQTLEALSSTVLKLTDAGLLYITPMKVQDLINRAVLESTLQHKGKENERVVPESTSGTEKS